MKRKSITLFLAATTFVAGCQLDNRKSITLSPTQEYFNATTPYSINLKHASQLRYREDSITKTEQLYLFNEEYGIINRYGLRKKDLHADGVYDISKVFPNTQIVPEGFYVISADSILFLSGARNEFCLTDGNFEPKYRWSLSKAIRPYGISIYASYQPLGYWKKRIYTQLAPNLGSTIHDKAKFNQANSVPKGAVTFLGESMRLLNEQGHFPKFLSADHSYNTHGPDFCVTNTGTAVYSFGAFPELYVYPPDGSRRKVIARSRYHQPPQEFPFEKYIDYRYLREYKLRNSEYGNILHDSYRQVYLRVYEHGTVGRGGALPIDDFSKKPWSLMILNEDLQVLKEIKFPHTYNPNSILVTRRGLLISPTRPGLPTYQSKQIPFQLFVYTQAQKP
ncbi:DUF4221 family protein [Hymenobacter psychrotolerans]|uniref:DUF4221 domain-containing protein n=1 Tax=Hymenobacter psychrotolerans DSM 18569 TaxID=1121959 RepID=A0A1M7B0Y2_9BACT|nr:DUF4221 family protein [Hymenobacter psychrotolerans]SHL48547.1 protein of unknown function [Hymenobacter psychrotolerans DSM 18569]